MKTIADRLLKTLLLLTLAFNLTPASATQWMKLSIKSAAVTDAELSLNLLWPDRGNIVATKNDFFRYLARAAARPDLDPAEQKTVAAFLRGDFEIAVSPLEAGRANIAIVTNEFEDLSTESWRTPDLAAKFESRAVEPLLLPPAFLEYFSGEAGAQLQFNAFDSFLFIGGKDLDPALYGVPTNGAVGFRTWVDQADRDLLKKVHAETDASIFGICRGMQMCSTAFGHELVQDIPTQYPVQLMDHRKPHSIQVLEKDSFLGRYAGQSPGDFLSDHHEAVSARTLQPDFKITAIAADGMVEGMESNDGRIVLFQFHPELSSGEPAQKILGGIADRSQAHFSLAQKSPCFRLVSDLLQAHPL